MKNLKPFGPSIGKTKISQNFLNKLLFLESNKNTNSNIIPITGPGKYSRKTFWIMSPIN